MVRCKCLYLNVVNDHEMICIKALFYNYASKRLSANCPQQLSSSIAAHFEVMAVRDDKQATIEFVEKYVFIPWFLAI